MEEWGFGGEGETRSPEGGSVMGMLARGVGLKSIEMTGVGGRIKACDSFLLEGFMKSKINGGLINYEFMGCTKNMACGSLRSTASFSSKVQGCIMGIGGCVDQGDIYACSLEFPTNLDRRYRDL